MLLVIYNPLSPVIMPNNLGAMSFSMNPMIIKPATSIAGNNMKLIMR